MNKALVITSIAKDSNPILQQYAKLAMDNEIAFFLVGDRKSPAEFSISGCTFLSIDDQEKQGFALSTALPVNSYSRKNIGYLAAIQAGANILIETDDDNIPLQHFFKNKPANHLVSVLQNQDWVNIYKYFSDVEIWPRGFPLDQITRDVPPLPTPSKTHSPILQGLADGDPDVDAVFRLTKPMTIEFKKIPAIALGQNSICPFNSQNTTWHKEAFPLLYLPSFCNFRMTDIWRSFIAQRIAWTCGWSVAFHESTVYQERNAHNLLKDFEDEIPGYLHNHQIYALLKNLPLKNGLENIFENLRHCYSALISAKFIGKQELALLDLWLADLSTAIAS